MKRKIIQIGSSLGIVIPRSTLIGLHLDKGSEVTLDVDEKNGEITIKPIPDDMNVLSRTLAEKLGSFIEKHEQYLTRLEEE
ncbi:MAG: AbrB/MazE/SpoVT family DNA-binding domain-containing protein [Candidatus Marinimicrobia bacterium]|nr:AbrB/MazE/SpoVT family DNA-binding domain-containing protein [Candidatus Neomarinimicrobiota bacterium]MCF7840431.1 AbrB/MazE/SpoVT family DNA-binding domain-containing protein [Candidatus Neomarinimicrobiota bacterium]